MTTAMIDPNSDDAQGLAAPIGWWRGYHAGMDMLMPLIQQTEALQARIDELMLEHCPDEMTAEQKANWAEHQKPVDAELQAEIDESAV